MSAPINLSSKIRAVTIYRRGAIVTREATLTRDGDAFPKRVQLVGLPLALDDGSLRVEVESSAGADGPIAGDLRVSISVPEQDPQLAPPSNAELERAQLEFDLAVEARDQLQAAKNRIASLQPVNRGKPEEGKPPGPSPTAARLELLSFRRERSEQLSEALAAANEQVRVLNEALLHLRERERIASSERNTRTYELRKAAVLELDQITGAELPASATVRLRYFVPGARWAPSYTLRLDRSMRTATLELRAMIGQSTGEDWRDVAVTLSTAVPQQWTELPELRSRRIGRRQPPPAKTGWRPPPVGAGQLYADYDRGLANLEEPLPPAPEDVEETFDLQALARQAVEEEQARMTMTRAGSLPPGFVMPTMPPSAPPPPSGPPPSFGGPPGGPPMPVARPSAASAPMPQRAIHPEATMAMSAPKRSAGIGSLVGGLANGIASAFAGGGAMDEGGGGYGRGDAMELEPELVAGRDLLDYGCLRMYPADSQRRGALRRIDVRMQYQQWSSTSVRVDLAITQIKEALQWASLLDTEAPPEGHRWPSSEGGFDYAYVAEAPLDIDSTGGFISLPIELSEAETKARYITVPRETQDVFRIVTLRNPLPAPLLPGPADVYVGGKFALTSPLELTPIGGRIELGLGVEQAIKIARNISYAEDSSGMFKRALELAHTIDIEVQNHLSSPALVEVRERVPVAAEAQADDMTITIDKVSPAWEDYEPERPGAAKLEGGRVWKVEVPAAGKRELSATYVVKIPTNHELVGGNRRES